MILCALTKQYRHFRFLLSPESKSHGELFRSFTNLLPTLRNKTMGVNLYCEKCEMDSVSISSYGDGTWYSTQTETKTIQARDRHCWRHLFHRYIFPSLICSVFTRGNIILFINCVVRTLDEKYSPRATCPELLHTSQTSRSKMKERVRRKTTTRHRKNLRRKDHYLAQFIKYCQVFSI